MKESERRRAIDAGLCRLAGTPVDALSSGFAQLDWALGGGFPRGRITELYGPEACGKTSIALHTIAALEARGGTAAYIDADHALDGQYARTLGAGAERLLVSRPGSGEEALEIARSLAISRAVDLIVVDSVAALVPQLELERGGTDAYGLQARLLAQAMRRISSDAGRSGACLLFLNQIRQTGGLEPETTAGGAALKLHASVRVELRRLRDDASGSRVRLRVVKNRVAPPFREIEFEIAYGEGIRRVRVRPE